MMRRTLRYGAAEGLQKWPTLRLSIRNLAGSSPALSTKEKEHVMETRYKCTLRPGGTVQKGVGTKPDEEGFVYLYGDGPWVCLTMDDVAARAEYPLESEPVTLEGRDAPAR
jgi:hypothetical protein